jgi:pimeloyl-ACP methyl ester carboxylesterase
MDGLLLMAPEVITDKAKRQIPSPQILVEDAAFLSALTPDEDGMRSLFVVQSVEALEAFRTVIIPAVSCADHAFLNRLEAQFDFSFSVDQLATPFQSPTLIVTGRQDSSCGYRDAWTLLDNYYRGTFAVLDRAGHGLGVEQKSLFQALVTEWLNRVEEQTTTSLHAPST